ncbi:MAG: DUF4105 domain-containing protein [Chitinophagaceae bacterium]
MGKILLLFSLFFFFNSALAQPANCHLRISLLTCSPGEELYSTFGHTALRVKDSITGTDIIYNYGTFEFGADFYTKFIKGKLLYFLSVENFNDFIYNYQAESRSIVEQDLVLNCDETQKLLTALQTNAREENKYYRYDFLFDNCTTRARDIVAQNTGSPVLFNNILPKDIPTFRNLIHTYLNRGGQYWSKLGIDLLLGSKLDKKVTTHQAMFLPDYLLKGFDNAIIKNRPLVTPPKGVLQMPSLLNKGSLFRPAIVFSLLLLLIVALVFIKAGWAKKTLYVFDFIWFLMLGLSGFLILFMWFGTDHMLCRNNYNLIWALPTHLPVAFVLHKNKDWIKKYLRGVFWVCIIFLASWFFLPQYLNPSLLPVILLIIFRSWHLSQNK